MRTAVVLVLLLSAVPSAGQTPSPSPSPPAASSRTGVTPSPAAPARDASEAAAENREALERIQSFLAGKENQPAETVFKNIELLRGKPAGRLPGMMSALTGLLGVSCSACHVPGNFASDELAAKKTARRHFEMQGRMNRDFFEGRNAITCFTCHRGNRIPASI